MRHPTVRVGAAIAVAVAPSKPPAVSYRCMYCGHVLSIDDGCPVSVRVRVISTAKAQLRRDPSLPPCLSMMPGLPIIPCLHCQAACCSPALASRCFIRRSRRDCKCAQGSGPSAPSTATTSASASTEHAGHTRHRLPSAFFSLCIHPHCHPPSPSSSPSHYTTQVARLITRPSSRQSAAPPACLPVSITRPKPFAAPGRALPTTRTHAHMSSIINASPPSALQQSLLPSRTMVARLVRFRRAPQSAGGTTAKEDDDEQAKKYAIHTIQ